MQLAQRSGHGSGARVAREGGLHQGGRELTEGEGVFIRYVSNDSSSASCRRRESVLKYAWLEDPVVLVALLSQGYGIALLLSSAVVFDFRSSTLAIWSLRTPLRLRYHS